MGRSVCPDRIALEKLTDGKLSEDLAARLNSHVEDCDSCQQTLETIREGQQSVDTKSDGVAVSSAENLVDQQLAHYEIRRELGRGAMGTVYLAFDTKLQREVALKVPQFGTAVDDISLERFYREARSAATLRHPGICPVYDVGEVDGQHYIAMAYIEGRPLSVFTKSSRRQGIRQAVSVIRKLTMALAEAHAHGVIHRDLKPANVMIDGRGEAVVMDFGLARVTDDADEKLTHTGTVIGTPAYMSPEQVEADGDQIGPQTDIYSLGVMLYELLTGERPFQGKLLTLLSQIASKEPAPPSSIRAEVDPELEAICLQMLAKVPEDRFASMTDVAAALTKWLRNQKGRKVSPSPARLDTGSSDNLDSQLQSSPQSTTTPIVDIATQNGIAESEVFDPEETVIADSTAEEADGLSATFVRPSQASKNPPRKTGRGLTMLFGGVAAILLGVVVLWVRLGKVDVKITIDDDSYVLKVDGESLELTGDGNPIRLSADDHELIVERDGLVVKTDSFVVKKDGKNVVHVAVVDGEVSVLKTESEINAHRNSMTQPSVANTKVTNSPAPLDANQPVESPGVAIPTEGLNYVLQFNPASQQLCTDEVNVPTLKDTTPSLTVELWALRDTSKWKDQDLRNGRPHSWIAGFGAIANLGTSPNGRFLAPYWEEPVDRFATRHIRMGTEVPVHLAAVRDDVESEIRFYVNGRMVLGEEVELQNGEHFFQLCSNLHQYYQDGGSGFMGWIDEVRVSSVARYYEDFIPQADFETDEHTLALYHCDEVTGSVLKDSSGNDHHGEILGAKRIAISSNLIRRAVTLRAAQGPEQREFAEAIYANGALPGLFLQGAYRGLGHDQRGKLPGEPFTVAGIHFDGLDGDPASDEFLSLICEYPLIDRLHCLGTRVSEDSLRNLAAALQVRDLQLPHRLPLCPGLLQEFKHLECLLLPHENTTEWCREAQSVPGLACIDMRHSAGTTDAVRQLKGHPALRIVNFYNSQWDAETLAAFGHIPNLQWLGLTGIGKKAEDFAGIEELANLRCLKVHDLDAGEFEKLTESLRRKTPQLQLVDHKAGEKALRRILREYQWSEPNIPPQQTHAAKSNTSVAPRSEQSHPEQPAAPPLQPGKPLTQEDHRAAVEFALDRKTVAFISVGGERRFVIKKEQLPSEPFVFRGLSNMEHHRVAIDDEDCRYLSQFNTIDTLTFYESCVTKDGLMAITKCRNLRWLGLPTDATAVPTLLQRFPVLQGVLIPSGDADGWAVSLKGHPTIEAVAAYNSEISAGIADLGTLPKLRFFQLTAYIQPEQIRQLASLKRVEEIRLANRIIDIHEFPKLSRLKRLGVRIGDADAQQAGEAHLRSLLPDCELVEWKDINQLRESLLSEPPPAPVVVKDLPWPKPPPLSTAELSRLQGMWKGDTVLAIRQTESTDPSEVRVNALRDETPSLTMELWTLRTPPLHAHSYVMGFQNARLQTDSNGNFHFSVSDIQGNISETGGADTRPTPRGRWIHVAAVRDAEKEELRFYINGSQAGDAVQYSKGSSPGPFSICSSNRQWGDRRTGPFFRGLIDEVRVSSVARYDNNFTPQRRLESDPDTLALYHFDSLSNGFAKDSSGNGFDAVVDGAVLISPAQIDEANKTKAPGEQTAWAEKLSLPVKTSVDVANSEVIDLILIPPGEFQMGCSDEQIDASIDIATSSGADKDTFDRIRRNEAPQHRVRITKPFLIGRTEVTVGQFAAFSSATGYKTRNEGADRGKNYRDPGFKVDNTTPASRIERDDANEFCKWLSERDGETYRLPTEAEWEYACRAGSVTLYSFGDSAAQLDEYAWYEENSNSRLQPAGSKKPNAFGLYDFHGSLQEWCLDRFSRDAYLNSEVDDPQGPQRGQTFVLRGGHWGAGAADCRSTFRRDISESYRHSNYGFRIVRELRVE